MAWKYTGSCSLGKCKTLDDLKNLSRHFKDLNLPPDSWIVTSKYKEHGHLSNYQDMFDVIGYNDWEMVSYNDGFPVFKKKI